jgi:transcriptional regulator with XRE-family HTH domain
MAPNPEHFAKVVRRVRRAKELTQQELADRSGVSLRTVIAIEHARSSYWGTLAVLAQALGIKFSELVKEAEKKLRLWRTIILSRTLRRRLPKSCRGGQEYYSERPRSRPAFALPPRIAERRPQGDWGRFHPPRRVLANSDAVMATHVAVIRATRLSFCRLGQPNLLPRNPLSSVRYFS